MMDNPVSGRKRWPSNEDKCGMECRSCGCKHFHVISAHSAFGGRVVRRLECRHCGRRLTTWQH